PFCDDNKTIIPFDPKNGSILSEQWDIIIWDNFVNKNVEKALTEIISIKNNSIIGVKLNFPNELKEDEESSLQAFAGWTELTGDPESEPLIIGGSPASYLIGAHAATAGLASLLEKKWTKKGRIVDINIANILMSALEGTYV